MAKNFQEVLSIKFGCNGESLEAKLRVGTELLLTSPPLKEILCSWDPSARTMTAEQQGNLSHGPGAVRLGAGGRGLHRDQSGQI